MAARGGGVRDYVRCRGETLRGCEAGARVEQIDGPGEFRSDAHEGLGIIPGAADEQVHRRLQAFEERRDAIVFHPARRGVGERDGLFILPARFDRRGDRSQFSVCGTAEKTRQHTGSMDFPDMCELFESEVLFAGSDTLGKEVENSVASGGGAPRVVFGRRFEAEAGPRFAARPAPCLLRDRRFQAAAADCSHRAASGEDQHPRARTAIGGPLRVDQRHQHPLLPRRVQLLRCGQQCHYIFHGRLAMFVLSEMGAPVSDQR